MVAGHLKETKGHFYCILEYKDSHGKRVSKCIKTGLVVKGNKRRATEMLIELRHSFVPPQEENDANNVDSITESMPLVDFLCYWLQTVKGRIAMTTYDSYESIIERKLIPYFGPMNLKVNELKAKHIQAFYLKEHDNGLSGTTINHEHALLHQAMKKAFQMDLVPNNPVDKVDPPKKSHFRGETLTDDEVKQLLSQTQDHKLGLLITMTLFFGLRRSEIMGLRWKAIDFKNKKLFINHTVVNVKNGEGKKHMVGVDSTKTKSSCRSLPLIPAIEVRLLALQKIQEENRRLCGNCYSRDWEGYVFVNEMGELLKLDYLESAFPSLLKKLGMRVIRFHDLRHTCATLMNERKVNLVEARDYLGHSSVQTTANIYTHLDWGSKEKTAEAIEQAVDIPEFQGMKNPWEK